VRAPSIKGENLGALVAAVFRFASPRAGFEQFPSTGLVMKISEFQASGLRRGRNPTKKVATACIVD
jgi:hypothetical protein